MRGQGSYVMDVQGTMTVSEVFTFQLEFGATQFILVIMTHNSIRWYRSQHNTQSSATTAPTTAENTKRSLNTRVKNQLNGNMHTGMGSWPSLFELRTLTS